MSLQWIWFKKKRITWWTIVNTCESDELIFMPESQATYYLLKSAQYQGQKGPFILILRTVSETASPPLTSKVKHANCGVIQIVQKSRQIESPEVPSTSCQHLWHLNNSTELVPSPPDRTGTTHWFPSVTSWQLADPQPRPGLPAPNAHAPSTTPRTRSKGTSPPGGWTAEGAVPVSWAHSLPDLVRVPLLKFRFPHFFSQNFLSKNTFIYLAYNHWCFLVSGNLLDPRKPIVRPQSPSIKNPGSDGGGKEAGSEGGFSLLGPLKLDDTGNVAAVFKDFIAFVPHWPHYVDNFTDSFYFIIL